MNFVAAVDVILEDEIEAMEKVSSEEWEFIHPSKSKHCSDILHLMNVSLNEN